MPIPSRSSHASLNPEERVRQQIDRMLEQAGWTVQDRRDLNLAAALGVAVREFPLQSGKADYLLFVDRQAVGVIKAKPEGTPLSGVAEPSARYLSGVPTNLSRVQEPLPFEYTSTGVETCFRDLRDPDPRPRRVFTFHRPETLREWFAQGDTLRARLRYLPPLIESGLRACQVEAIKRLEVSLREDRPRSLLQMATGSGKTYTAVSLAYRLIKLANVRRVLFLVDRRTLGRQTFAEFQQYVTPDDGRKFTELYNVQHLTSNAIDPANRVVITTIQRLCSVLRGEAGIDDRREEVSGFEPGSNSGMASPLPVAYNPTLPIETFDLIIADECHPSIYDLWRHVLEYFDAFLIGLTATPSRQTLGYFNQNLVMEYGHERAVADGVNVDLDLYRIKAEMPESGKVEAGFFVAKRDRQTGRTRWEQLDEDLEYAPNQLDRAIFAPDQIRTVIRTFKEKLFTEIFPGRKVVPKTLIFAQDDAHAEDIVWAVREEFGQGNDFCKKIAYKINGETTESLIAGFRHSYNPRIAVTVDLISTGTDIKPLECLLFMRDVRSSVYFEQMKGRGARTISPTDFNAVTPDAQAKTHCVIVDAVGVCENDKTDSRPLERKPSIPFDRLVQSVAHGVRDEETLTSLAGRLARLDCAIGDRERHAIAKAMGGVHAEIQSDDLLPVDPPSPETIQPVGIEDLQPLRTLANRLLDAVDANRHVNKARELFGTPAPTGAQVRLAAEALLREACEPFERPEFRNALIETRRRSEPMNEAVSRDRVIAAGYDLVARGRARRTIETFESFIAKNREELTALQIIYNRPYAQRRLNFREIRELAEAIAQPPYELTADTVWEAYEQLEKARARGPDSQRHLTDLVSLVRFAIGEADELEPFSVTVDRRFEAWLAQQEQVGRVFSPEQREWLTMLKDHIAASLSIDWDDFDTVPFSDKGGRSKAYNVFGQSLNRLIDELNTALAG